MSDNYVKIDVETYYRIKEKYDGGYKKASDECKHLIKDIEDRNEKLKSSLCVVNINRIYTYDLLSSENSSTEIKILNEKSTIYNELHKYIYSIDEQVDRITKFNNSRLGKFLSFFGVKI